MVVVSPSCPSAPLFLILQLLTIALILFTTPVLSVSVGESNTSVLILPIVVVDDPAMMMQMYTVFLREPEGSQKLRRGGLRELEEWHLSFLPNATLDSGEPRLVYSYRHTFSGFMARLTPREAAAIAAKVGVISAVADDGGLEFHTTYTPKYLGLRSRRSGDWTFPNQGEGMVIGVVDSGIIHTHASFDDTGVPKPPARFVGRCGPDASYCNKKIVRAVSFPFGKTDPAPLDVAPNNHGTHVASIAAGNFVRGVSVNGGRSKAIASGMAPMAHLAIYQRCQTTDCNIKNSGPAIDQAVGDEVDVINYSIGNPAYSFFNDPSAVGAFHAFKSGIVMVAAAGNEGSKAGSVENIAPWLITVGNSMTDRRIKADEDDYKPKPNPKVHYTSGRGPARFAVARHIMKPDVIAPGYEILGATPLGQPTNAAFVAKTGTSMAAPHVAGISALLKKSHPDWSPAAVKSALMTTADRLDADGKPILDFAEKGDATLHAMGAGQVNPTKANDPGLIYDMSENDYYPYLCGLGYTNLQVEQFSKRTMDCNKIGKSGAEHLNLPSIAISLPSKSAHHHKVTVQRTATNVGEPDEEYTASVIKPDKVDVDVHPHMLKFKDSGEEKTFSVEFKKHHHHSPTPGSFSEGHLIWTSAKHVVRSPILIRFT